MLARALSATGTERAAVLELAQAQARGDADAVLRRDARVQGRSPPARPTTQRVRRPSSRSRATVEILQYRPSVQPPADAHDRHRPRRLARGRQRCPVVQCVRVRRDGPLTGAGVELLSISAPIGREAGCPQ